MNLPEEAKNLITNARLNIYDTLVMFADTPEGIGPELVVGNNVSLVIQTRNEEETHNHGVIEVRKGFWFLLAQPLLKQHHSEQGAHTHVQATFGDVQGQNLTAYGQTVPVEEKCLRNLRIKFEKVDAMVETA